MKQITTKTQRFILWPDYQPITTHLPTPEGWMAEFAMLADR